MRLSPNGDGTAVRVAGQPSGCQRPCNAASNMDGDGSTGRIGEIVIGSMAMPRRAGATNVYFVDFSSRAVRVADVRTGAVRTLVGGMGGSRRLYNEDRQCESPSQAGGTNCYLDYPRSVAVRARACALPARPRAPPSKQRPAWPG